LYTTPCFQYPFGHGLAPARRLQLLERAAEAGTVVFEDDYDSEFRDDSQPRPALASAADELNATVLHAGTFSKLMFPAVRLAWLVLPSAHVSAAKGVLRTLGGGHNVAQQRAVAELLDNGTVAKHLVRARSEYGRRRRAVIDCLASGPLQVRPGSGGLSLVIDLPEPVARAPLVTALREQGVGAQPLEQLSLTDADTSDCHALVVGTGNVDVGATTSAVERLLAAWRQVC
ncbi:MAG: PLP-dependent aminotransferase family protein, partial [Pseudomonadota bacterium]